MIVEEQLNPNTSGKEGSGSSIRIITVLKYIILESSDTCYTLKPAPIISKHIETSYLQKFVLIRDISTL